MQNARLWLRNTLFNLLRDRFDLDELRTLCFLTGIDEDELPAGSKSGKVRELLIYAERHGLLAALVASGRELRPDVAWPAASIFPAVEGRPDRAASRQPFEPETVLVPAGEFLMGSDPAKDAGAYDNEQPQHVLALPEVYLSRTPVTNAQYLAFVLSTGGRAPGHWPRGKPRPGRGDRPVVDVTWYEACAYCRWLAGVTGRPYRLPGEAEWEKGARGGFPPARGGDVRPLRSAGGARIYPWGDQWDAARCNARPGGRGDVTPAGAYPEGASPYGLLDMAGNVWEWTRSLWGEDWRAPDFRYPYDPADGREDASAGDRVSRVVRGGAFVNGPRLVRCAARGSVNPHLASRYLGFRVCAVSGMGDG